MKPPSPPPEGKGRYRKPYPARKGGTGDRTERRWEGSKADEKADREGMKRTGMSKSEWERSAEDRKADAAAQRKRVRNT